MKTKLPRTLPIVIRMESENVEEVFLCKDYDHQREVFQKEVVRITPEAVTFTDEEWDDLIDEDDYQVGIVKILLSWATGAKRYKLPKVLKRLKNSFSKDRKKVRNKV